MVYAPDESLRTTVRRVVGYRAVCECGYRTGECDNYGLAAHMLRVHRRDA